MVCRNVHWVISEIMYTMFHFELSFLTEGIEIIYCRSVDSKLRNPYGRSLYLQLLSRRSLANLGCIFPFFQENFSQFHITTWKCECHCAPVVCVLCMKNG
jgi:hypothetical protein